MNYKGDGYKAEQRKAKEDSTMGYHRDVQPSKPRKVKSRERKRERTEYIGEIHTGLTRAGAPRSVSGGKLGARKRLELLLTQRVQECQASGCKLTTEECRKEQETLFNGAQA